MDFAFYNGNWDNNALSVLSKVSKTDDYIAYRCGAYKYVLLQGDVVKDGTILRVNSADYTLYDARGHYYVNQYGMGDYYANCVYGYGASGSVDYTDGVVYSSIDGLPRLSDTEERMTVLETNVEENVHVMEGVGLICASILVYLIVWSVVKHAVLSLRWSSLQ